MARTREDEIVASSRRRSTLQVEQVSESLEQHSVNRFQSPSFIRSRPTMKTSQFQSDTGRAIVSTGETHTPRSVASVTALRLLIFSLTALAITLRGAYYVRNPSLSVDEASLALNITNRSFSGLFGQLDFNQAAPAGFLVLQKLLTNGAGATPYGLRILPLFAGVVASLLVYPVAMRVVGRNAAILALALVAISDPLIAYASTDKQYSIDVAVALALYAMAFRVPTRNRARDAVWLSLTGAVAVWLSHPAAFVLAAIGLVSLFRHAIERRWNDVAKVAAVTTVWCTSFIAAYALTRPSVEQIQHSIGGSGSPSVLPGHGRPGLLQTYGGIVRSLFGIPSLGHGTRSAIAVVAILLVLVGLVVLLRTDARVASLLILPAGIALIACEFDLYPLYPRTFLFVIPSLTILVSAGIRDLSRLKQASFVTLAAGAAVAVLLATTGYATMKHLQATHETDTTRALRYLAQKTKTGDSLYVYLTAQYDFRYYLECGCFGTSTKAANRKALWPIVPTAGHAQFSPALRSAPPRLIAGSTSSAVAADYRSDFQPLRGRERVWVLIIDASPDHERGLDAFLDRHGTRKDSFPGSSNRTSTSLLLYDLRGAS